MIHENFSFVCEKGKVININMITVVAIKFKKQERDSASVASLVSQVTSMGSDCSISFDVDGEGVNIFATFDNAIREPVIAAFEEFGEVLDIR